MEDVTAMKNVFVYGTVVIALTAAPAWAQQPNSVSQGATAPAASASAQQNADQAFMLEAAMGSMAEVELGQLAASKAERAQVKQFAQRMVTDHGKANAELKALAQSKTVTLPTAIGAQHKALEERLSKLSGAAFDRAYMEAMVSEHRKAVTSFRTESQSGKDAEVKAWAAKTLPTLEQHLEMAQRASRPAVGTSGTTSDSDPDRGTTGGNRGTTGGDTARPGSGSGAGGGTSTGTGTRPGTGSGGATDGAGSTGPTGRPNGSGASGGSGSGGSGAGTTPR